MPKDSTDLARHGLIVMLIGLIGGFGFTFAMLEEVSLSPIPIVFAESFPGAVNDWRILHLGCLLNGIMALGIAATMSKFDLGETKAKCVVLCVAAAIWGNTVFYFANLSAPNRSLSLGSNALGEGSLAGAIGYVTALIGALALIYAICVMVFAKAK